MEEMIEAQIRTIEKWEPVLSTLVIRNIKRIISILKCPVEYYTPATL